MTRRTTFLVLFLAFAAPIHAQSTDRTTRARLPGTAGTDSMPGRLPEADVFMSTLKALGSMSLKPETDSALWEAGIQGMIASLKDPYAEVQTPQESDAWQEETTGNYSGIGLTITLLNEEVTVTGVFRGTPANDAGIQVGDVIVGVNQNDASKWTTDMTADSIRGPVGTEVRVRIRREGVGSPIPFDIKRAEVHVPAVTYGRMKGNIGYALLDRVARNAAQEMNEALQRLGDTRGLIIDLRRNPGGFLDESLMLADLFLKPGSTLASTTQRVPSGPGDALTTESYQDRWPAQVPDLPVVILVDGYTASGAEIFAGALQDYDRALILGERSFGKGLVQTVMPLPHGRRLRFTTGEWQTPLGRSIHRPRDMEMRPLPENLDTLPHVSTPGGRDLLNGGGIFPDVAIPEDTLTLAERDLLKVAADKEVPLGTRLAEFSFGIAKELKDQKKPAALDEQRFSAFLDSLIKDGVPADVMNAPGVREYLEWRTRMTIAARLEDIGQEADFRMERDPVLTEAVKLLDSATTQAELFKAADADAARRGQQQAKEAAGRR